MLRRRRAVGNAVWYSHIWCAHEDGFTHLVRSLERYLRTGSLRNPYRLNDEFIQHSTSANARSEFLQPCKLSRADGHNNVGCSHTFAALVLKANEVDVLFAQAFFRHVPTAASPASTTA